MRDKNVKMEVLTVDLGDDDKKLEALMLVLRELGGTELDSSWGVGGSVVLETLKIKIETGEVSIEADNYQGVSISGPHKIVSEIVELIASFHQV